MTTVLPRPAARCAARCAIRPLAAAGAPRGILRAPLRGTTSRAGFSIVELMVAILIGMIVVLILMQLFAQTEQWNRNATSGGDTQNTAQIAVYSLTRGIAEAGGSLLATRARPGVADASDRIWVSASTAVFLPILPVRIVLNPDDANAGDQIEIVTQSGVFGDGGLPLWRQVANATDPFLVRSFQGIEEGGAATDKKSWLLVSRNTSFGSPEYHGALLTVPQNGIAPGTAGGPESGLFRISHSSIPTDLLGLGLGSGASLPAPGSSDTGVSSAHWIQGLGMLGVERLQVKTLNDTTGLIRERREFDAAAYATAGSKSFEAPHVVYLKAYYGFDNQDVPTGQVTHWLAGSNGGTPNCAMQTSGWTCAGIRNDGQGLTAQRLIAVRFGIVVRSPQHDRSYDSGDDVTLWKWNCGGGVTCPPNDPVYAIPADARDYRYYSLQSTVPLRSAIWNVKPTT